MQFQQLVSAAAINADLKCKYLEVFPLQPVVFGGDPQPFGLIQPFGQYDLTKLSDALAEFLDAVVAIAAIAEQLIQLRNLSGLS
jgi:hypothetical protein